MDLKNNRFGTRYYVDKGEIISKECTKCKRLLNLSEYKYSQRGLGKRYSKCKSCEKEYREENKELYDKYYEENKDYLMEYKKNHYQQNIDRYKKLNKLYRIEHKETKKENDRVYKLLNKEKYAEYNRKYYYKKMKTDKNAIKMNYQRRRAKVRNLPYEFKDTQNLGNKCLLTGDLDCHIEHAIPIKIGHGGTIKGNIYLLRSDLNRSKGDLNLFEWFKKYQSHFKIKTDKFNSLVEFLAKENNMSVSEYKEFYNWCFENRRSIEEIAKDNLKYGYRKPSSEIWREERGVLNRT